MTYFTRTFCTVIMCLTLAACLPGKKQEEAVIEKAADATDTVRLEKVAADMGNPPAEHFVCDAQHSGSRVSGGSHRHFVPAARPGQQHFDD